MPDVYETVTNAIVTAIENGAGDFKMPWHRTGQGIQFPKTIATDNRYNGINILALWVSAENRGYETGLWGTYRQWAANDCQVRRGEKATTVVFYKEYDDRNETDENGKPVKHRVARASPVFNAEQVDGYQLPELEERPNLVECLADVETFIANTGAAVSHGGSRAFYRPSTDEIAMPEQARFHGTDTCSATEAYYSTYLHELCHWTGSEKRLDRKLGGRFGDDDYAMEELVAELGAAFLCTTLGITVEPRQDHAAYVQHWLTVMKADKKAIFTASAAASKAHQYLENLQPEDLAEAA